MVTLSKDPVVKQLARDLSLRAGGDAVVKIKAHALQRIDQFVADFPGSIGDLDLLRRVVSSKLGVRLEFIYSEDDVIRIGDRSSDFHSDLRRCLEREFLHGDTEGITLEREIHQPGRYRFLAVVDARGGRSNRAFFTAWHELSHLVIHPEQLPIPGFRRTQPEPQRKKDALESVVDIVAGAIAFYPPLFTPVLSGVDGTFRGLDEWRSGLRPAPSLYATAVASLPHRTAPSVFLQVELDCRASEKRARKAGQAEMNLGQLLAAYVPRAKTVIPDQRAAAVGLQFHPHIRVPGQSVIMDAFHAAGEFDAVGDEDQSWWETSKDGALSARPIRVHAARRGRFVYGLVEAV